jgi:hypothetical protein
VAKQYDAARSAVGVSGHAKVRAEREGEDSADGCLAG